MFCIKELGEQNAMPGTCGPEDLWGSDVPCDRAVLGKEDSPAPGPQIAGRLQITMSGLIGEPSGVGRQTHITSTDRLFYLQLSCSMPWDQIVLPKLKMFFLLHFVKWERASEDEGRTQELISFTTNHPQTTQWITALLYTVLSALYRRISSPHRGVWGIESKQGLGETCQKGL